METTEQILTRQRAQIDFSSGKVEYFSISTQWDKAETIEEAINKILEADKKYNGKAPLNSAFDKLNNTGGILTTKDIERILSEDQSYYNLLGVHYINEV